MEYFEKKITYLRGLCDGSDFPAESKEGKIFHGILDVLDDMAFMLETFMDDEDLVMEDEDLDETDEPIFFYSFNCPSCGQELDVDEQTMEMQTEIPCAAAQQCRLVPRIWMICSSKKITLRLRRRRRRQYEEAKV